MATVIINSPGSHSESVAHPSGPIVATAQVSNDGNGDGWVRLNITGGVSRSGQPTHVPAGSSVNLSTSVNNPHADVTIHVSAEVEELDSSGERLRSLGSHNNFRVTIGKTLAVRRAAAQAAAAQAAAAAAAQAAADKAAADLLRLKQEQDRIDRQNREREQQKQQEEAQRLLEEQRRWQEEQDEILEAQRRAAAEAERQRKEDQALYEEEQRDLERQEQEREREQEQAQRERDRQEERDLDWAYFYPVWSPPEEEEDLESLDFFVEVAPSVPDWFEERGGYSEPVPAYEPEPTYYYYDDEFWEE